MNTDSEIKVQATAATTPNAFVATNDATKVHVTPSNQPTNESKAIVSMILGIVGIVVGFLGLCLGPAAIVLGLQAKKRIRESQGQLTGDGFAIAGIVTGAIGLVIGIAGIIWTIAFFATFAVAAASVDVTLDDNIFDSTLTDDIFNN